MQERPLAALRHAYSSGGISGAFREGIQRSRFIYYHHAPWHTGQHVFDADWNACLILDGCRPDALEEVSSEYDFLPPIVGVERSIASCSDRWMQQTFSDSHREILSHTVYVSANPYTPTDTPTSLFQEVVDVSGSGWDSQFGTVPAEVVTDAAIKTGRKTDPDRLLIHYMQPHFPSVPDPLGYEGIDSPADGWDSPWDGVERGELSIQRCWDSYIANLRYVLDEVESLLQNLDASRVLITADHGNAIGEHGVYGHPKNIPLPAIRNIPWVYTEATDDRTREGNIVESDSPNQGERLEALGYK